MHLLQHPTGQNCEMVCDRVMLPFNTAAEGLPVHNVLLEKNKQDNRRQNRKSQRNKLYVLRQCRLQIVNSHNDRPGRFILQHHKGPEEVLPDTVHRKDCNCSHNWSAERENDSNKNTDCARSVNFGCFQQRLWDGIEKVFEDQNYHRIHSTINHIGQ